MDWTSEKANRRPTGSHCHESGKEDGGLDHRLAVEVERSDIADLIQPGVELDNANWFYCHLFMINVYITST